MRAAYAAHKGRRPDAPPLPGLQTSFVTWHERSVSPATVGARCPPTRTRVVAAARMPDFDRFRFAASSWLLAANPTTRAFASGGCPLRRGYQTCLGALGKRSKSGVLARRLRGYSPLRSNGFARLQECANPPIPNRRVDCSARKLQISFLRCS